MKNLKILLVFLCTIAISSCASLKPVSISRQSPITGYKYAYITPTSGLTSSNSGVYGNAYGLYGSSQTKSVNPSDIISGYLIKYGFTIVPEITSEIAEKTIIINYGENGRRNVFWGYTIEITLQILNANTHEVICTSTAEGMGSTEADDIRIAINRALEGIFTSNN